MVIFDRRDYINKIDNSLLIDEKKFTKVNLKDDILLNFDVSQEKPVDKVLKKLIGSKCMTEKNRKLLKPVGSRTGVMYSLCKVHQASQFYLHWTFLLQTYEILSANFETFDN